jgi:hypothetical protein
MLLIDSKPFISFLLFNSIEKITNNTGISYGVSFTGHDINVILLSHKLRLPRLTNCGWRWLAMTTEGKGTIAYIRTHNILYPLPRR